jgi:excisionase family DNA binding protein
VKQLLTPEQLADECQVPVSTIYRWNYTKTGPAPCRVGKHVRYRRSDVDAWLDEKAGQKAG